MENQGWIKLHRSIFDESQWEWTRDINTTYLFIYLVTMANHKDNFFMGETIPTGSIVIGLKSLSRKLPLSIQQIRTALKKLEISQKITIKTSNKYSVVSIKNYKKYQQVTNNQQTSNKQVTTNKNDNNDKNIYIELQKYLDAYNQIFKPKRPYTSYKTFEKNFIKWREEYSLDEIINALKIAKHDRFWGDKLKPETLLRTRDTNQQGCDRIGALLNSRTELEQKLEQELEGVTIYED